MAKHFSNTIIDQILYSGIRNKHHLKIRKNGYFRHLLKLTFLLFYRKRKDLKTNSCRNIINFIPSPNFQAYRNFLPANTSFVNTEDKSLLWIEWYLTLAFLVDYKPLQRKLFSKSGNISHRFIKEYNIEILICGHPTFFITFLSYILNNQKKKVVTIQHGIYNLNFYQVLWFEKEIATHIIVYGNYFKDLYISQSVVENNLIVGSPYFESDNFNSKTKSIKINLIKGRAVFIGQQLYKVNSSIFEIYNEVLSAIYHNLKSKGIDFFYKPHPRENIEKSLDLENRRNFKIYNNKNKKIFWEDFDIFLSANSSLLLESYLQRKICFQVELPNPEMAFDNFSNYTGIQLIKVNQIKDFPFEGNYDFYCDDDYLNLVEKPVKSLLLIIADLLKMGENK